MCAIAGICTKNGKAVSRATIQKMIDAQAHRGPDGEGIFIEDNVGLGHRRLSIIDLSDLGRQPMTSSDGRYVLTFNGELYNYLELKKELQRKDWKSSSDSEVLLAAYETWGDDCVKKFNGIFAFAIWDRKKKELFCARDHVGVKPFYYTLRGETFSFASEIKALLAAGFKTSPNEKLLYDFLVHGYYQHTNETFFAGIQQLPAGHTLTFKKGKLRIQNFWNLEKVQTMYVDATDKEVETKFRNLFEDAIRLQLRSDVPVGMQLSGGFDSSAVVAMAHKVLGGQKNARLFSFVSEEYKDKELPFMRSLAKGLGWKLESIPVRASDMPQHMEEVLYHQDEPFPGLPTFGQHLMAKRCREEGVPVALGGQGGDEIGAGYEYYMGAHYIDVLRERGADAALKEFNAFAASRKDSNEKNSFELLARMLSAYYRGGTSADGTSFVSPEALSPQFLKRAQTERSQFSTPFSSALSNMQYRDIVNTKLPRILHSSDRSAMAYGVEHRVPLLDYRLVEFSMALPSRFKIRDGVQRRFMRRALRGCMPSHVLNAPKRAVPSPQREWFKKELRPWIRGTLSSKSFGRRPYFNQTKVLEAYDAYCATAGVPANSFHIWQWIFVEYWMRTYFD